MGKSKGIAEGQQCCVPHQPPGVAQQTADRAQPSLKGCDRCYMPRATSLLQGLLYSFILSASSGDVYSEHSSRGHREQLLVNF